MIIRLVIQSLPFLAVVHSFVTVLAVLSGDNSLTRRESKRKIAIVFFVSLVVFRLLKISFYHDLLDLLFTILVIAIGPVAFVVTIKFSSKLSKITTYTLSLIGGFIFYSFVGMFFILLSPQFVRVDQSNESRELVKIYSIGAATTRCNYEVKRTVLRFVLFERELSSEKKLTVGTPGLCREST